MQVGEQIDSILLRVWDFISELKFNLSVIGVLGVAVLIGMKVVQMFTYHLTSTDASLRDSSNCFALYGPFESSAWAWKWTKWRYQTLNMNTPILV
jgi:hypothetical protein